MALAPIRIPNLTQSNPLVDREGRATNEFIRRLGDVFKTITDAVNGIITAQNAADAAAADAAAAQGAADGAQTTADQGVTDAATAQATADAAQALAATAVQQDVGLPWIDATGTASRALYTSYAGQTVSAAYVQAEAQVTDNAVKALSQGFVALVNDLKANGVLT